MSLPEIPCGQVCARPQPAAIEARASSLAKSTDRVSRSRCFQDGSAPARTTEKFRFVNLQALPRRRARTADPEEQRWPRTARWIRPAARMAQQHRYSRAAARARGSLRKRRAFPRTLHLVEDFQQVSGGKWPQQLRGAPARVETGDLQRGTASSDFLWLSIMRSLRRCLIRSSSWPQNFRKYCAADTSALITTSHRRNRPRRFSRGCCSCRAPAIRTATAHTCKTIFVLPNNDAAIVNPSAEAMFRKPSTVNSRPITITTIHAGTRCISTRETKAAEISNLSAIGSRRIPRVVTCRRRGAKYPSAQSVAAAISKIKTPQNSKCIGKPQKSTLGLLVSKTAISRGTKKMRRTVSELGRFIETWRRRGRP